jgi:hypothetical protein
VREVEVGLCVVDGVETLEFVRNTFNVETALVPGIEDATYASFPNRVAKIASSPSWCYTVRQRDTMRIRMLDEIGIVIVS